MLHQRLVNRAALHGYEAPQEQSRTRAPGAEDDQGPGLLVSPAFWIGGLLSVAVWAGIAAAFGLI